MKKRMRKLRFALTVALAVGALMALYVPSAAAQGGGGSYFSFEGDVTLDPFPGSGSATFNGNVANGTAAGITVNETPVAVVDGTGTIDASFNYSETTCAFGQANGSATVSYSDGTTTVDGSADFDWVRVGATAAVVISSPIVEADAEAFINVGGGAAVAAFTTPDPVAACTTTGEITAHVTGAAAIAGAAV